MKQKLLGSTLYVFQVEPYQITEDASDATTIKVQQEVVAGFKELNESLADKIVAYNYHVACVNVPEWAPYVDQDDPSSTITVTVEPYNLYIFDEDSHEWVTMEIDQSDPNIATGTLVIGRTYSVEQRHGVGEGKTVVFDPDCGTGEQGTVGAAFIAPDSDLTITLSEAPADTYTVHITESSELYDYVTLKINGETITGWDATEEITGVADNSVVDIYPTEDPSDYIPTDELTWDTDHWTTTIDGEDLYILLVYSPEVTITLNASNLTDENVTVMHNGGEVQLAGSYTCHRDDSLYFYPLEDPAYYTASNMSWEGFHGNGHWAYHAGVTDDTIGLTYTAPTPEQTHVTVTLNDWDMSSISSPNGNDEYISNVFFYESGEYGSGNWQPQIIEREPDDSYSANIEIGKRYKLISSYVDVEDDTYACTYSFNPNVTTTELSGDYVFECPNYNFEITLSATIVE